MRKWFISISILFLLATVVYGAVYFWIIPASAKLMVPFKWNRVPLNQKREVVTGYFGTPSNHNYNRGTSDTWIVKKNNYEYILRVNYSKDTLAKSFSIQYKFSNSFFYKTGTIVSSTR